MKNMRHEKILDLIRQYPIDRQETLLEYLKKEGFDVTQATISRDIRQLHLVKTQNKQGAYIYVAQTDGTHNTHSPDRFETIFRESVLKADYAGNIVLIKCYNGMANAACELFDAMPWENVVGTLSGDDTFFVLMRSEDAARKITETLKEYIVTH